MQKIAETSPSADHRTNLSSQLKHVLTIGKKLVKHQYLLHVFTQYGELRLTNGWDRLAGLGTPENFNVFRVLASLLQSSPEANQTWHDAWPSPGLVHYINTFGISCFLTEFCHVQNSLSVHLRAIALVSRAIS